MPGGVQATACIQYDAATSLSGAAATASSITYYDVYTASSSSSTTPTTLTLSSQLIASYYLSASTACKGYAPGDAASLMGCSALANLCALNFASPTSSVCTVASTISSSRPVLRSISGWHTSLPLTSWGLNLKTLQTDSSSLPAGMLYYNPVPSSGKFNTLRFYLASFSLNGTFTGLKRLRHQFNYCTTLPTAPSPSWLQFGFGFSSSLSCDLFALITEGTTGYTSTSLATLSLKEPVFYDLYIEDMSTDYSLISGGYDSGGTNAAGTLATAISAAMATGSLDPTRLPISLVPVPVRITNYRDSSGATPNKNTQFSQESDDVFTGRFTLLDAASSVDSSGFPPTLIRYASDIRLTVTTDSQSSSTETVQILLPILTLTYKERLTSEAVSGGSGRFDTLSFSVEYTRSTYLSYTNAIFGLGISFLFCALVLASTNVLASLRMNVRSAAENVQNYRLALHWLVELISVFSPFSFALMLILTLYWLIFFKLQVSARASPSPFTTYPRWLPRVRAVFPPNPFLPTLTSAPPHVTRTHTRARAHFFFPGIFCMHSVRTHHFPCFH